MKTHCNDMENLSDFACQKWFNQINQKTYVFLSISVLILIQHIFVISRLVVYKTENDVKNKDRTLQQKLKIFEKS